ncbi:MAG: hypothetical protein SO133_08105, partial [Alloprevotella sp.]|nr:hypothetical protein [Alloprevotella sp.]
GQKNHCFTKHIEKFICRREISTGFSGNFSGQVGARIDDIGSRKVKRYLFSNPAFFTFRGFTQVNLKWQILLKRNVAHLAC